jgi:hypothetical protein
VSCAAVAAHAGAREATGPLPQEHGMKRRRWTPLLIVGLVLLVLASYFAGFMNGIVIRPPNKNEPPAAEYAKLEFLRTTPEGNKVYRACVARDHYCLIVVDQDGHTVSVEPLSLK